MTDAAADPTKPRLVVPDQVDLEEHPPEAEVEVSEVIESPSKVLRIGSMIRQLLEEVRRAPLDEAGRARLADIHQESVRELAEVLSPDLREELGRLTLPFD